MASGKYVKVEAWGGDGGDVEWEFLPDEGPAPYRMKQIIVTYTPDMGCVIALTFYYEDANKNLHVSKVGSQTRGFDIKYTVNKGLLKFKGEYGYYSNLQVITSLAFGDHPLPKRNSRGTPFSLSLVEGRIAGFYGNYGDYLDNIGPILSP
ncbi:horcolin-like [Rutidosis leptorrhynchoides]|uniref:horcolin-like n=1 Tax=Rutidosis leptorrhynchoides TaxID=125765 RepID=UPI003A993A50